MMSSAFKSPPEKLTENNQKQAGSLEEALAVVDRQARGMSALSSDMLFVAVRCRCKLPSNSCSCAAAVCHAVSTAPSLSD